MTSPRWLLVHSGSIAGTAMRLAGRPVMVGRDPSADLRMDPHGDRLVSGSHALVGPAGNGWTIRDLESRNGTFVNGRRIEDTVALRPGDRIQFGRTGPIVEFTDREPSTAALSAGGGAPPTRESGSTSWSPPHRLLSWGIAAAGVVGLAALLTMRPGAGANPASTERPGDGGVPSIGPAGGSTSPTSDETRDPADVEPGDDPRDQRIADLEDRIAAMEDEVERARAESDRLRGQLNDARRSGASDDVVEDLERRLLASEATIRRQQLAASIDYELVQNRTRAATAQVYVQFSGGQMIAATAVGVDPRGLLVTNRHIVRRGDGSAVLRVAVQYADEPRAWDAEVLAVSPNHDLAILGITEESRFPAIRAVNERGDTVANGSPVALLGFPLGGSVEGPGSAPRPVVSGGLLAGRSNGMLVIDGYGREGASGSPVVDATGALIGIVRGGTTEGGERLFAVPALRILELLASVSGGR